ncbi:MAG: ABC transporter permease [Acidimicrobiia bacterium]
MTATTLGPVAAVGSPSSTVLRRFIRQPKACLGAALLLVIVAAAVLAPQLAPGDPDAQSLLERLQPPSGAHLLGTDDFGRDALSRLIYGSRVSLVAAAIVLVVSGGIGIPLGVLAGYRGGRVDALLDRANDGFMSIPALILALSIVATLGSGLTVAMVAVGVVFAPRFFRVARAASREVARESFVEASRSIGARPGRVVVQHVLRNILPTLVVQAGIVLGTAVNAEASLSFLGLGAPPPTASWGSMLSSALSNLERAPHLAWPPGVLVVVTVLAFGMVGDGLARALSRDVARGGEG